MHALIITATSGGGLTYQDNDIIQVLDGHVNPGSSVTPTESGFSFCYISDKDHDDPDVVALMQSLEDNTDPEDPIYIAKRRYALPLVGSEFQTWVEEDDAASAGIEKTWAEVQALLIDKEA